MPNILRDPSNSTAEARKLFKSTAICMNLFNWRFMPLIESSRESVNQLDQLFAMTSHRNDRKLKAPSVLLIN